MCGICGIVKKNEKVEEFQLKQMLNYLQERGPDNTQTYLSNNVALGHTRLSIIDLMERSNQPFIDEVTGNVISFNGEIYNFKEVQLELKANGIKFRTASDTEVILKAYQQWGIEKSLIKLDGMFSFCIYDCKNQDLVLARDRFGKKPLYYLTENGSFFFSSDIRSIWVLNKANLTIDWESIDYYFSELSVPQPKTIWKEIQQIKPAHYIKYNIKKSEHIAKRYWWLPGPGNLALNLHDTLKNTEELLTAAIRKRMVADVPLGFFLSSGIDSGLIVALASQLSNDPIKTFTVTFDNSQMDESKNAYSIAEKYQTEHTNVYISPLVDNALVDLISYMGEPFADSSLLPAYLITREIKKNITVAISGDGGDELFGGYYDYGLAYRSDIFLNKYGDNKFKNIYILIDKFISRYRMRENLGAYHHYSKISGGEKLYRGMGLSEYEKRNLYLDLNLTENFGFTQRYLEQIWQENITNSQCETIMRSSLHTRLLNDYLVKVDRSSMKNSVEVRSPFLDRELAEFSFSLDYKLKYTQHENKYILRSLARKHLGINASMKPKLGFGIPIHLWLRTDLLKWRNDLIHSFITRKILRSNVVLDMLRLLDEGKDTYTHKIWSIICLELWFQQFIDH